MQHYPSASGEKVPARDVCARYKVVPRTIDRWLRNADLQFPQPLKINNRRYWDISDLEKWERQRAATKVAA